MMGKWTAVGIAAAVVAAVVLAGCGSGPGQSAKSPNGWQDRRVVPKIIVAPAPRCEPRVVPPVADPVKPEIPVNMTRAGVHAGGRGAYDWRAAAMIVDMNGNEIGIGDTITMMSGAMRAGRVLRRIEDTGRFENKVDFVSVAKPERRYAISPDLLRHYAVLMPRRPEGVKA